MILMLTALSARAQEITRFNVPASVCAGDSAQVSFGFQETHNIVIKHGDASMGHSEEVFLPDGQSCGAQGCSYQSPVTFTDFDEGATITSANDINYLRLNMEHSFLGDLYINVTCPNGQKADILRFSNYSGNATVSSCLSSVPSSSRGWNGPSNANHDHAYLGIPNRTSDNNYYGNGCTHNSIINAPGTGWNYCWSNNTNSNYTYADNGGYVYRSVNQRYADNLGSQAYYRVDSSNVAAGTNFYHPDENFASLVGCPLNGTWYIEVIDGVQEDNGYIFEWELALNPTLLTNNCDVTGYSVSGPGVIPVNDSVFIIGSPDSLTADSTTAYTFTIQSTCGNIDSTVYLTFHPSYHNEYTIEGCESVQWKDNTYTANANITESNQTRIHSCDSISRVHLIVHPGYHLDQAFTVVENDLPYTFLGHTFNDDVTDSLITGSTAFNCDSNINFSLTVYRNVHTSLYDTVCPNALPYHWNGLSLTASADTSVTLATSYGADSVVSLALHVLPSHDTLITIETVENQLPVYMLGQPYYDSADTTAILTNIFGCDSVVAQQLIVHHNQAITLRQTICDDRLPYLWDGNTYDSADTIEKSLHDRFGADSVVTFILTVNPTYTVSVDTVICDNHPYALGDSLYNISGTYSALLATAAGCDSSVTLRLTVNPHDEFTLFDTICANDYYTFGETTYHTSGIYKYVYTNIHGCDSSITLNLGILGGNLKAEIKAIPTIVTPTNPDFDLHDNSAYAASRLWTIEGNDYTTHSLSYTFPEGEDTLDIRLVAYSVEGCTDTAHLTIHNDRSAIFTPNAFTPNQSTNNTWQPALNQIQELEVWIYSRTGLLVAHLEGVDLSWDGTSADGTACPQGAYVYTLQYRTTPRPDKLRTLNGTILLIR